MKLSFIYTAEKFGFDMLDPNEDEASNIAKPYYGPLVNMSILSQIQRGNYTINFGSDGFSLYEPPPVEVYIHQSKQIYFLTFLGLQCLQIIIIWLTKVLWLKDHIQLSPWKTLLCSVEQSHFPFPNEDWDARDGGCLDHIKRKVAAQKEFLVITIINLLFNLVSLFPMIILCKFYLFDTIQNVLETIFPGGPNSLGTIYSGGPNVLGTIFLEYQMCGHCLSMWTNSLGDQMSRGTKSTGTVCLLGPNAFGTKCVTALK